MESPRERLASLLKQYAEKMGKQTLLADEIGIKTGTLNKYIQGESYPNFANLEKIAFFVGMTAKQLDSYLKGEEEKVQPLKVKEKGATYQVNGNKAEDLIPIAAQLPDSEKIRLARFLLDVAVS
jgi:transcriptional regulator with XRE-family HTH domain